MVGATEEDILTSTVEEDIAHRRDTQPMEFWLDPEAQLELLDGQAMEVMDKEVMVADMEMEDMVPEEDTVVDMAPGLVVIQVA